MSDVRKETALAFIQAMSDADAQSMARCTTDDAVTYTKGYGQVSGWRNRETMLATTAAFHDIVPTGFRHEIVSIVAEGDKVVVEFEGNAELSNGTPYCNQYVFIFTFAGDRICQLNEYFCTVLADRTIMPLLARKGEELAHGNH